MPKRTRAQRRAEKRARVERAERVKPTPETLAKLRPWPMQSLLAAGPPDGIDPADFEAALQIVETFKALVADRALRPSSLDRVGDGGTAGMSDRDARRCAQWFAWASHLPRGLPVRLVAWIEDDAAIGSVEVMRRACRLWERIGNDMAKAAEIELPRALALDTIPQLVLTSPPSTNCDRIDARAGNLAVGTRPAAPATTPHAMRSNPFAVVRSYGAGPRS